MSGRDDERLADLPVSAEAIASHLERGSLDDGLVFDAVRVRLIEIGEAVKDSDPGLLAAEPDVPWRDVAGNATTSRTATSTPRTRSFRQPLQRSCRPLSPQVSDCWPGWTQPPTRKAE